MIFLKLWVSYDDRLFGTTYLKKVHTRKKSGSLVICGFLKFKLLHTKLSYLVLVPEVRNQR